MDELTEEQIAKNYSAAMDSADLILKLKAKEVLTEEESDRVSRNIEHLVIMLNKDYWTTEDLTPFSDAIG